MTFKSNIEILASAGLTPFVATSRLVLEALDRTALGRSGHTYLLEREEDRPFHEAFRLANALGFTSAAAKMPEWVMVDCVLMQTAIVGFAIAKKRAPPNLLREFQDDSSFDLAEVDALPVSGQIAGSSLDGRSLVGFSLFSLRRYLSHVPALGMVTKALALQVYRAQGRRFVGLACWDNKALSMQGRFGRPMKVESTTVPIYPAHYHAMTYSMVIDFDPDEMHERERPGRYDFLLRCDDEKKKHEMSHGQAEGHSYIIVPPYQIEKNNGIEIPIRIEHAV